MDGGSSNRFVSETSLKEAQERRKEEWQKAYARLGQEAPPLEPPAEEKYDPRTLYEKLKEQKDAKQAAFEEKYSIRNQFRHGLEDDEASFIASVLDDERSAEAERQAEIDNELAKFKEAVSAKAALPQTSPPLASTSGSPPNPAGPTATSSTSTTKALPPPKKKATQKGLLAGAIKRKSSGVEKDAPKRKLSASAPTEEKKSAVQAADNVQAEPKNLALSDKTASKTQVEVKEKNSAEADTDSIAKKRKVETA